MGYSREVGKMLTFRGSCIRRIGIVSFVTLLIAKGISIDRHNLLILSLGTDTVSNLSR